MTDLKDRQENTLAVVEACIAVDMDYKVNNAIEDMICQFHEKAQRVLRSNVDNFKKWMHRRLEDVGASTNDKIEFDEVNKYNETDKMGLQSIPIKIIQHHTNKELRTKDEKESPTIFVAAKGMVKGPVSPKIITFPPATGIMEDAGPLSKNGPKMGAQKREDKLKEPEALKLGQRILATSSSHHVTMVLEAADEVIGEIVTEAREGVGDCLFREEPEKE